MLTDRGRPLRDVIAETKEPSMNTPANPKSQLDRQFCRVFEARHAGSKAFRTAPSCTPDHAPNSDREQVLVQALEGLRDSYARCASWARKPGKLG